MIFEIPFKYSVSGFKEGNKTASTRDIWEIVEIDVPVVDDEEAPIAVEWDERPILPVGYVVDVSFWGPVPEGGLTHARHFDGSYWRPILACEIAPTDGANVPLAPFELQSRLMSGRTSRLFVTEQFNGTPSADPARTYATIHASGRDKKLGELHTSTPRMLVVGDTVYRKCEVPRIGVFLSAITERRPQGELCRHGTILRVFTDLEFLSRRNVEVFSVTDWRRALSSGRRKNATNARKEIFNNGNEMRRPDVRAGYMDDPWSEMVARCQIKLQMVLLDIEASKLPSHSTADLRRYCEMRDGLEMVDTEAGLAMIEDAVLGQIATYRPGEEDDLSRRLVDLAQELGARPISTAEETLDPASWRGP